MILQVSNFKFLTVFNDFTEPKPYYWQAPDDSSSFSGSTNPWSTLSSSVPAAGAVTIATYNTSPLSDILTDLSSTSNSTTAQSVSPNLPSHSPSQVILSDFRICPFFIRMIIFHTGEHLRQNFLPSSAPTIFFKKILTNFDILACFYD